MAGVLYGALAGAPALDPRVFVGVVSVLFPRALPGTLAEAQLATLAGHASLPGELRERFATAPSLLVRLGYLLRPDVSDEELSEGLSRLTPAEQLELSERPGVPARVLAQLSALPATAPELALALLAAPGLPLPAAQTLLAGLDAAFSALSEDQQRAAVEAFARFPGLLAWGAQTLLRDEFGLPLLPAVFELPRDTRDALLARLVVAPLLGYELGAPCAAAVPELLTGTHLVPDSPSELSRAQALLRLDRHGLLPPRLPANVRLLAVAALQPFAHWLAGDTAPLWGILAEPGTSVPQVTHELVATGALARLWAALVRPYQFDADSSLTAASIADLEAAADAATEPALLASLALELLGRFSPGSQLPAPGVGMRVLDELRRVACTLLENPLTPPEFATQLVPFVDRSMVEALVSQWRPRKRGNDEVLVAIFCHFPYTLDPGDVARSENPSWVLERTARTLLDPEFRPADNRGEASSWVERALETCLGHEHCPGALIPFIPIRILSGAALSPGAAAGLHAALLAGLGDDLAAWDAFEVLRREYDGPLSDVLRLARAVTFDPA